MNDVLIVFSPGWVSARSVASHRIHEVSRLSRTRYFDPPPALSADISTELRNPLVSAGRPQETHACERRSADGVGSYLKSSLPIPFASETCTASHQMTYQIIQPLITTAETRCRSYRPPTATPSRTPDVETCQTLWRPCQRAYTTIIRRCLVANAPDLTHRVDNTPVKSPEPEAVAALLLPEA